MTKARMSYVSATLAILLVLSGVLGGLALNAPVGAVEPTPPSPRMEAVLVEQIDGFVPSDPASLTDSVAAGDTVDGALRYHLEMNNRTGALVVMPKIKASSATSDFLVTASEPKARVDTSASPPPEEVSPVDCNPGGSFCAEWAGTSDQ